MNATTRSRINYAIELAVVGVAYYLAARFGLNLTTVHDFAAFVWPPTGIAIAALFLRGNKLAPAVAVAAFLVNFQTGAPAFAALAIAAGNTLEALAAVSLLQLLNFRPLFARLIDSFNFILVSLSASVVSATIGVSALALTPLLAATDLPVTWLTWWTGDALGALIVGSFLLRWFSSPRPLESRRTARDLSEIVLFFTALITLSLVIFWEPVPWLAIVPAYMLFVPLTWGALRMGPRMMTLALVTLATLAFIGTLFGTGPFAPEMIPVQQFFMLQLFLGTITFIFLLFVSVVEERKETARRLQQNVASLQRDVHEISEADSAKNDFIATLSHELRNPLTPVLSTLELMQLQTMDAETGRSVTTIRDNVLRMARLLDDLLDVARISRKKMSLQMSVVPLNEILENCIAMAKPLMEKRGHTFTVELPANNLMLNADPLRIEQIVANLLTNASKYTPAGGRISLVAKETAVISARGSGRAVPGVEISVRDNGFGIPRGQLEHIFEPFKQLAAKGPESAGLGIGLSLARRLVELHDGTIVAKSDGPGTGSEFTVSLPTATPTILLSSEQERKTEEQRVQKRSRKKKQKILIVDDNEAGAGAIAKLLNHSGHEAQVAYDGAQALAVLSEFRPDVIFLDIGLPGASGYELAQTLRSYLDPQPLIVALTGYGQEEDKQRALEAGFDDHLIKPVSIADLERALAAAA